MYGEDSSEFVFVYPKDILQGTPSSTEEDGVKFAVVLKEGAHAFWYSKDGVAMRDVLDNFTVDM